MGLKKLTLIFFQLILGGEGKNITEILIAGLRLLKRFAA